MAAHGETLAPAPERTFESLLSFDETRGILDCSRATLYRLLARGDLQAVKVGGRLKFQPEELRDFFDRERVGAP
jgi:excisionase family DNA binding protein